MADLKDIPKDLWINHILPNIHEPLTNEIELLKNENELLKNDIITLKSKLKETLRVTFCEMENCHLDLIGYFLCECNKRFCKGHIVITPSIIVGKYNDVWCKRCYEKRVL